MEDKFKGVEPFLIKNKPGNPFLSSLTINGLNSSDFSVYRCYDVLNKYAETSLGGKLGKIFKLFKLIFKFKHKKFKLKSEKNALASHF